MLGRVVDDAEMLRLLAVKARLGTSPEAAGQRKEQRQRADDAGSGNSSCGFGLGPDWFTIHELYERQELRARFKKAGRCLVDASGALRSSNFDYR